ncbi:MAG: PilT/PilU family type 4a pilus ATPase [Clostridioides sp.]|jgi:twitching motility protein PilT|nr:PilT/PilU family type 4a pilus ATPase [Clostridioides sp.]
MNIFDIFDEAIFINASDIHIFVDSKPVIVVNRRFKYFGEDIVSEPMIKNILDDLSKNYTSQVGESIYEKVKNSCEEIDFSIEYVSGKSKKNTCENLKARFRFNLYKQKGEVALSIRVISCDIPDISALGYSEHIYDIISKRSGLILVTGATGSGKSTTLASIIDYINTNFEKHIITIEDPIEYVHTNKLSIVNQREVGQDTRSFCSGVRASLRQNPDVILIGEIRDEETMQTALRAAETGHLVFSTLHTGSAVKSLDRILDMFNPSFHYQIRTQIASVLECIISQKLIIKEDKKFVVSEIMITTNAIRNLIRDGKFHQINNFIQSGSKYGMKTMEQSLMEIQK